MTKIDILSAAIFGMKMGHKYLYEKEHNAKYFFEDPLSMIDENIM